MWQVITILAASKPKGPLRDLPYYFGNSFAKDLLNLRGNEMKSSSDGNKKLPCELSILFAASGDLKNAIKTVQSLPSEYAGTVLFVMNDADPFVTARNILILFMLSTFEHARASNIASIYLSLRLTKEDYFILQGALSTLIKMDPSQLKEKTGGVIEFKDGVFNDLREVWTGWSKLPCLRKDKKCANLDKERQRIFHSTPLAESSVRASLKLVPKQHVPSIKEWFENGVIRPSNCVQSSLPYYNPTFTGRSHDVVISPFKGSPASWKFSYCVSADCATFQIWDYLDLMQYHALDSVTEMCHEFTTYCFKENITLMKERRVSFKMMTKNFTNLGVDLLKDVPSGFDRIYTSNLIDYHGIDGVIQPLEPLLSRQNPKSILFTETFNWYGGINHAVEPDNIGMLKLQLLASKDLSCTLLDFIGMSVNVFHEYYDNTDFFTCYIRGSRLAESGKPCSKSNLPKWSEFTECHGLRMHDIHNGRNSVLPYRLRVNARPVNMLRGHVRTLEWSRTPVTNCQVVQNTKANYCFFLTNLVAILLLLFICYINDYFTL
ncbi:hypothetical protein HOLleu_23876 [Holothuria leucospilota]|uniref:DUF4470 domain-containing protein n=1 Tax=Holothuria leucospilota TaxID=206669 RepID=A0A9Q1H5I0_HOLLE|nr:hypothetical protein HOLleu_23876 [Holothuria leucospilota]